MERPRTIWLLLADSAAVVVFTLVGLASHRHTIDARGLLHDTVPLLGSWLAAVALLRPHRRSRVGFALIFLGSMTAAVAIRALALDRPWDGRQAAFLVTTLGFSSLLVVAFRLAPRLLRRRPTDRAAARAA